MKQRVIDRLEVERDRAVAILNTAERHLFQATSQNSADNAFADMCHYDGQVLAYNNALAILREERQQEDTERDSEKS